MIHHRRPRADPVGVSSDCLGQSWRAPVGKFWRAPKFRAKGEISNGAVEGLNNKIRVVTRRSYGFRTFEAMEIALYHNLGRLPEPESPHKFC